MSILSSMHTSVFVRLLFASPFSFVFLTMDISQVYVWRVSEECDHLHQHGRNIIVMKKGIGLEEKAHYVCLLHISMSASPFPTAVFYGGSLKIAGIQNHFFMHDFSSPTVLLNIYFVNKYLLRTTFSQVNVNFALESQVGVNLPNLGYFPTIFLTRQIRQKTFSCHLLYVSTLAGSHAVHVVVGITQYSIINIHSRSEYELIMKS